MSWALLKGIKIKLHTLVVIFISYNFIILLALLLLPKGVGHKKLYHVQFVTRSFMSRTMWNVTFEYDMLGGGIGRKEILTQSRFV